MNFMLNGHLVSVSERLAGTLGNPTLAYRVAVGGEYVGTRGNMADALTLATIATSDGPHRPRSAESIAFTGGTN